MFCDVVPSSRAFNLAYLDVIDGPARGLWYGLAGQNVTIGR
ncbi:MAG: hypothetical protein ACI8QC_004436, partial [Planctomycetota bacterium]